LADFIAEQANIDYNLADHEVYLYHGTNCYRRWEIKRTGFIEPGRNHYSFFCTRPAAAYRYARAACIRDINSSSVNSLICEPVVLKVKFNARNWVQVDFVNELNSLEGEDDVGLCVAVLGPISASALVDVLHCMHGRRLGSLQEATRTFENGTFLASIYQLRGNLGRNRPDAWMLKYLGVCSQAVSVRLAGGEVPTLTLEDDLRRLRQVRSCL
jgi:hypothetical protein